jgi:dihydrofolate reductase
VGVRRPGLVAVWAEAGIEESLESFGNSLVGVDCILLGRRTYEDLEAKWPRVGEWPDVSDAALRIGEKINRTPKVVVTDTLAPERLPWGDFEPATRLGGADVEGRIGKMKQADGGDIITFGSPTLVQSLTNAGLVDEYRILVHPVVMHEGRHLFDNLEGRTDFRLVGVDTCARGAMMVTYAPIR